jgi:hypothetical protein
VIEWLLTPLSGASIHLISDAVSWHGRLMVLAWGVFAPVGILMARYWKITPGQAFPAELDSKVWWNSHRVFQSLCALMTLIAIAVIYRETSQTAPQVFSKLAAKPQTSLQSWHHFLGYCIGLAVVAQIAHALFRGSKGGPTEPTLRGDHYDMTPHRIRFERIHKSLGWISMFAAWATMALGLVLADAPRWMPISLAAWWGALALCAWRWQRAGRCVDTYQAIWGLDAAHPGNAPNAAPPIGIGVRKMRNLE